MEVDHEGPATITSVQYASTCPECQETIKHMGAENNPPQPGYRSVLPLQCGARIHGQCWKSHLKRCVDCQQASQVPLATTIRWEQYGLQTAKATWGSAMQDPGLQQKMLEKQVKTGTAPVSDTASSSPARKRFDGESAQIKTQKQASKRGDKQYCTVPNNLQESLGRPHPQYTCADARRVDAYALEPAGNIPKSTASSSNTATTPAEDLVKC